MRFNLISGVLVSVAVPGKAAEQQLAMGRLPVQPQGPVAPETQQGWRTLLLCPAAAWGLGTLLLAPQSSQHAEAWEKTGWTLHAAVREHAKCMLQSALCHERYPLQYLLYQRGSSPDS